MILGRLTAITFGSNHILFRYLQIIIHILLFNKHHFLRYRKVVGYYIVFKIMKFRIQNDNKLFVSLTQKCI